MKMEEAKTTKNSTYPKLSVQWLNFRYRSGLCFFQSLCLYDCINNRVNNRRMGEIDILIIITKT